MTCLLRHVFVNTLLSKTCLVTYPLLKHVRARTSPHFSLQPCLDMTSFGNVLLLFITMTSVHVPPLPFNQIGFEDDVIGQHSTINNNESQFFRQYDVIWQHYCVNTISHLFLLHILKSIFEHYSPKQNFKAMLLLVP